MTYVWYKLTTFMYSGIQSFHDLSPSHQPCPPDVDLEIQLQQHFTTTLLLDQRISACGPAMYFEQPLKATSQNTLV